MTHGDVGVIARSSESPAADRPLTIVAFTQVLATTGGDRWLYALQAGWLARGHRVVHVHVAGGPRPDGPRPPDGVELVRASGLGGRAWRHLPRVLVRMVRQFRRADVVLLAPVGKEVPLGYAVARLLRRPVVVYSQGLAGRSLDVFESSPWRRRATAAAIRGATEVFCVSPASARAAAELGVAPARTREVRTGLDLDAVRARAGAPGPRSADHVVACGVLSRHKGFDRLVRAIGTVRERGVPARLTIIGPPGDAHAELVDLIHDLGLDDAVELVTQETDPVPLMAGAATLVHVPRYELVGLVLLEALAVGTPVISCRCDGDGPALVLDGGRYGELLPTGEADELAHALERHLRNPAELQGRLDGVEQHIRAVFSVDAAVEASLAGFRAAARHR